MSNLGCSVADAATLRRRRGRSARKGAGAVHAGGTGGVLLGAVIGQAFDGSTVPLAAGFVVAGAAALAPVLVTERGRLFGSESEPVSGTAA